VSGWIVNCVALGMTEQDQGLGKVVKLDVPEPVVLPYEWTMSGQITRWFRTPRSILFRYLGKRTD
jgi:hypothetical protein